MSWSKEVSVRKGWFKGFCDFIDCWIENAVGKEAERRKKQRK